MKRVGEQQYAALRGRIALDEASALVWARTGTVVWSVLTTSVKNPFGFSKSEALTELTKYARKQKQRVGAG